MATVAELQELHTRLGPMAYQKAMAAACWQAGDLSYACHVNQERAITMVREAYTRGERRMVWNIARRFGKSRAAVVLASELALGKPRARIPYAAMTQGTVEGFIEPHLRELADDAPPSHKPIEHDGDWVFPSTEGRIVMRGCEDRKKADRLRGPSADAAIIDEAGFIPDLDYVARSIIGPQLLTTDGWMLLSSSPPLSPEHPFRTFAVEAEAAGAYMHGTVYDAPHLSRDAIERQMRDAGGELSDTWQREYLARFVVDMNRAIVPEFQAIEAELVGTVERPEHFDAYVVGDLGYSDLTVLLFAYWHFGLARIVVEDELVLRRPTSDVIHAGAAEMERVLWPGRKPFVRAVDARGITLADMRKLQPELEAPDGGTQDPARWHSVANDELEAAVNALRVTLTRRKMLIHPRCKVLRAHLRGGTWNASRTSFARIENEQGGHHFDALAAAVYLNRTVRLNKNPNPDPLAGVDLTGKWVHYDKIREASRDERFRKAFSSSRMKRK